MINLKKISTLALAATLAATATYAGDKIQRVSLKVAGESTWVPSVQVRDDNDNLSRITTALIDPGPDGVWGGSDDIYSPDLIL